MLNICQSTSRGASDERPHLRPQVWAQPVQAHGLPDCCRPRQVICLQSFVRRWLAQQRVSVLRRERDRRLAWEEEQLRRRREEKKEQLMERHHRWSNPQRRDDFNQLYRSVASKITCRLPQHLQRPLTFDL